MVDIGTKFVMMTIHLLCPKKMKILQLTDLNMAIAAQRISSHLKVAFKVRASNFSH
jgi:hypothetical protein